MVIKEELVRLEQLLLLHVEHVLLNVVAHNMVVFHVVVADGLTTEHDQVVRIDHVQAHEPDAPISYGVQHDPRVALDVQLLNARSVAARFIAYGVDEAAAEGATVGTAHGLLERGQGLLVHCTDLEILALLEVLAAQGATDDVHEVFKLGNSKVNAVVHHFAERAERLRGDVEEEDLRARYVSGPVELVSLVAADDQDVALVNDHYFALADLLVEHLEARPLQSFKVIEGMLIEFSEVEQLLTNRLARGAAARLTGLRLVHGPQVLDLALRYLQLPCQMLHTVVHLLLWRANDADVAALSAPENNRRARLLMREELLVWKDFGAALTDVRAAELKLAQEVARHTVDAIELALLAAVGACIRVLLEPVRLAVAAKRLLACLALDWVLEHIIADATDELRQERLNVRRVENLVLFVDELRVLPTLVNYAFHCLAVCR